ncbi:thiamine pyrophosphate-binding protein [Marinobacteraceae bacterium S3BR75-40.1]
MQHGGSLVADFLQSHGVRSLFTLCGGHISPILNGCKLAGIRVIDTRHEASAVFAADATARLTGIPGVAAVTAGPGVTNAVTALKNAQLAQSPVVLLGGASATVLRGRGSLQDIDQMSLLKSCVKATYSVKTVRDIQPSLEEAFETARSGVPGPVFVELPIDLLYPEATVREWYGIKGEEQAAVGLGKKALQLYLNYHTHQMFKSESGLAPLKPVEQLVSTVKAQAQSGWIPAKDRTLATVAARALRKARKPVMVLGSQVTLRPEEIEPLVAALERWQIPVYLSGMARGLLGRNHPLQLRHKRRQALKEADLVLLAGVPCDFRLDYGNHIRHSATLISVNRSREDLFKNRIPTIPVWSDPAGFLQTLGKVLDQAVAGQDWMSSLKSRDLERDEEIEHLATQHGKHINPLDLLQRIDAHMAADSQIIADGGDFVATAAYTLRPRGPLCWLDPGVFGTLGVGGGFALGAMALNPHKETWIIYGDGSSAYSLAEFDTYVRHGMGVIAVVGNDACWNQIARDQVEILHDDVGVMLRATDYHKVAEGYGGVGMLLDKSEDIEATLIEAQKLARQGKPVLINAILDRSDFRKGSISV